MKKYLHYNNVYNVVAVEFMLLVEFMFMKIFRLESVLKTSIEGEFFFGLLIVQKFNIRITF